MASGSGQHGGSQLDECTQLVHERCAEDPEAVFRQADFEAMGIVPAGDVALLMGVIQKLSNNKLVKVVREASGHVGWMYRSPEDAAKYRSLTREQEMAYELIDEAGAEGIWTKTIKTRTGLHESTLRSIFKFLEGRRYISDLKTVQHPHRKMYIKTNVQPSDAATGGAWFTDGELDDEFIGVLCEALYKHIWSRSFYRLPASSSKSRRAKKPSEKERGARTKPSVDEIKAQWDTALATPAIKVENEDPGRASKRKWLDEFVPHPPGYQGYPTLHDLTVWVDQSSLTDTALSQEDIQALVDVLCYDKQIVKVKLTTGHGYRAIRTTVEEMEDGPSNGLTEAPCGRCPVFDLCEEGGPVGPSNCPYFKEWLAPDPF